MRTEIFKNFAEFASRPDWSVNGVTQEFADAHPGWDEERGNRGCWRCSDCSDCSDCRAGWVVTLAGDAGKALEAFHNTELAATLIYAASSPIKVSPPRFFESNEVAMADMVRCAEEERALGSEVA